MLRLRPSRWVTLVALALLGAVALAVVMSWRAPASAPADRRAEQLGETLDRALQRSGARAVPKLAIRPLATRAGDPALAVLADALCEGMANRLARMAALRVTACGSTRLALAAELDDRRLAHLLAADYLLKGDIEAGSGERYRLRVALHDARDGRQRWQIDDELDARGLQELPARIAQRTGETLGAAVSGADDATIAPAQYRRFIAAQQLARRPSVADRREALARVDELLRELPDYAPALYLRLGLMSMLSGYRDAGTGGKTPQQLLAEQDALLARIRELGERLVRIDPGDRRGNVLLLNHAFQQRRWSEAFERIDTLLRHVEHHPGVLRIAARLHLQAGYLQRARQLALDAARLDALDAEAHETLATLAGALGDDVRMVEFATIAGELGHRLVGLQHAIAAYRRHDWSAFETAFGDWVAATQRETDWVAGFTRALADPARRDEAARRLDGHDEGLRSMMSGYFLEYALLGDTARSLAAVQHHARLPPATWGEHLWWPELAAVRRDPGFAQVVDDLGLPALWEQRGAPDLCHRQVDGRWRCR